MSEELADVPHSTSSSVYSDELSGSVDSQTGSKKRKNKSDSFKQYYSKHAKKINARHREYYMQHADQIGMRQREYYAENAKKINSKHREYYAKNAEAKKAKQKEYYMKNATAILAKRKEKQGKTNKTEDNSQEEEKKINSIDSGDAPSSHTPHYISTPYMGNGEAYSKATTQQQQPPQQPSQQSTQDYVNYSKQSAILPV
ncbi:hypothetical protein EON65_07575 [archaeon]|nr:MAG: hypothetical protein EON65_07575 [archaeon]